MADFADRSLGIGYAGIKPSVETIASRVSRGVEARFTTDIMATRYESVYYSMIRPGRVRLENLSGEILATAAK